MSGHLGETITWTYWVGTPYRNITGKGAISMAVNLPTMTSLGLMPPLLGLGMWRPTTGRCYLTMDGPIIIMRANTWHRLLSEAMGHPNLVKTRDLAAFLRHPSDG